MRNKRCLQDKKDCFLTTDLLLFCHILNFSAFKSDGAEPQKRLRLFVFLKQYLYMFYLCLRCLKKRRILPPSKLYISNNSIPLKTDMSCGELELILAGLAEATPQGNDDTDFYKLFLAVAVQKLQWGSGQGR